MRAPKIAVLSILALTLLCTLGLAAEPIPPEGDYTLILSLQRKGKREVKRVCCRIIHKAGASHLMVLGGVLKGKAKGNEISWFGKVNDSESEIFGNWDPATGAFTGKCVIEDPDRKKNLDAKLVATVPFKSPIGVSAQDRVSLLINVLKRNGEDDQELALKELKKYPTEAVRALPQLEALLEAESSDTILHIAEIVAAMGMPAAPLGEPLWKAFIAEEEADNRIMPALRAIRGAVLPFAAKTAESDNEDQALAVLGFLAACGADGKPLLLEMMASDREFISSRAFRHYIDIETDEKVLVDTIARLNVAWEDVYDFKKRFQTATPNGPIVQLVRRRFQKLKPEQQMWFLARWPLAETDKIETGMVLAHLKTSSSRKVLLEAMQSASYVCPGHLFGPIMDAVIKEWELVPDLFYVEDGRPPFTGKVREVPMNDFFGGRDSKPVGERTSRYLPFGMLKTSQDSLFVDFLNGCTNGRVEIILERIGGSSTKEKVLLLRFLGFHFLHSDGQSKESLEKYLKLLEDCAKGEDKRLELCAKVCLVRYDRYDPFLLTDAVFGGKNVDLQEALFNRMRNKHTSDKRLLKHSVQLAKDLDLDNVMFDLWNKHPKLSAPFAAAFLWEMTRKSMENRKSVEDERHCRCLLKLIPHYKGTLVGLVDLAKKRNDALIILAASGQAPTVDGILKDRVEKGDMIPRPLLSRLSADTLIARLRDMGGNREVKAYHLDVLAKMKSLSDTQRKALFELAEKDDYIWFFRSFFETWEARGADMAQAIALFRRKLKSTDRNTRLAAAHGLMDLAPGDTAAIEVILADGDKDYSAPLIKALRQKKQKLNSEEFDLIESFVETKGRYRNETPFVALAELGPERIVPLLERHAELANIEIGGVFSDVATVIVANPTFTYRAELMALSKRMLKDARPFLKTGAIQLLMALRHSDGDALTEAGRLLERRERASCSCVFKYAAVLGPKATELLDQMKAARARCEKEPGRRRSDSWFGFQGECEFAIAMVEGNPLAALNTMFAKNHSLKFGYKYMLECFTDDEVKAFAKRLPAGKRREALKAHIENRKRPRE